MPGVTGAGIVTSLPLYPLNNTSGQVTYKKTDGTLETVTVGTRWASSGYFTALGIPLKAGRIYRDDGTEDQATVINERLARRLWGDVNSIGRQVREGGETSTAPWRTIVGVVGDLHHVGLDAPPDPEMFAPYHSNPWSTMAVVVRGTGDLGELAEASAQVVRDLDAGLPLVHLSPVTEVVGKMTAGARFLVDCAAIFSGLGLFLAAFGTFAVLSLLVAQRTREIGIRMALGATPHRVRWLMLTQAMLPALVGCVAGGVAAAWTAGALSSLLFGIEPRNATAFATAMAALLVTALIASWLPARRAMRIDPVHALRSE